MKTKMEDLSAYMEVEKCTALMDACFKEIVTRPTDTTRWKYFRGIIIGRWIVIRYTLQELYWDIKEWLGERHERY